MPRECGLDFAFIRYASSSSSHCATKIKVSTHLLMQNSPLMIQKLAKNVIEKLRSSSEIASLNDCVLQLLFNSLDADAGRILLSVDFEPFSVEVCDDGVGLPRAELDLLGERYATSKSLNDGRSTHGFHGEALANVIELSSRVDISSRPRSQNPCQKGFKKSFWSESGERACLIEELDDTEMEKLAALSANTIVRVEGLFNAQLERRLELGRIAAKSELKKLIASLETISLVNYGREITLVDSDSRTVLFRSERASSLKLKFTQLFGFYMENHLKTFDTMLTHPMSGDQYRFKGAVYLLTKNHEINVLHDHSSARLQFIYYNGFHVESRELYELVCGFLASSPGFNPLRRDPRELIFCLAVSGPSKDFETFANKEIMTDQGHKGVPSSELADWFRRSIRLCLQRFLDENGLKKTVEREPDRETRVLTPAGGSYGDTIHADELSGTRVNKLLANRASCDREPNRIETSRKRKDDVSMTGSSGDEITSLLRAKNARLGDNWVRQADESGRTCFRNLLSGRISYDLQEAAVTVDAPEEDRRVVNRILLSESRHQTSAHLIDLLQRNKRADELSGSSCLSSGLVIMNQSILTYKPMNRERLTSKFIAMKLAVEKSVKNKWLTARETMTASLEDGSAGLMFQMSGTDMLEPYKLGRSVFRDLNVTGQIDSKFIAGMIKEPAGNIRILLLDQHACHERVRLENLLQENIGEDGCFIQQKLKAHLNFRIKSVKAEKIEPFARKMRRLGFSVVVEKRRLTLHSNQQQDAFENLVKVDAVPVLVGRKLSKSGQEIFPVINRLLERMFHASDDSNQGDFPVILGDRRVSLANIPQELIDVFNMEACRGAIKFGDTLARERCVQLVKELSECALPFQCAHGRPTVIPLVNVNTQKRPRTRKLNFGRLNATFDC